MDIIYNQDGSIKYINLAEFVNQNSHNVNSVFVAINNYSSSGYSLIANFELPNGETNQITASVSASKTIGGETFYGKSFYLTNEQTYLSGKVKMSVSAITGAGDVLATYNAIITVNKTTDIPDETKITQAQYLALVQTLTSYQPRYVNSTLIYYPSLAQANADKENLSANQIVFVRESNEINTYMYNQSNNTLNPINLRSDSGALKLYKHTILDNGTEKLMLITADATPITDTNSLTQALTNAFVKKARYQYGYYDAFEYSPTGTAKGNIFYLHFVGVGSYVQQFNIEITSDVVSEL